MLLRADGIATKDHKEIGDNPMIVKVRGSEVTPEVNEIDRWFGPEPVLFAFLAVSRGHLNCGN
jgi:hypothetical protein